MNKFIKISVCALTFASLSLQSTETASEYFARVIPQLAILYGVCYTSIYCHETGHALTYEKYTGKKPEKFYVSPFALYGYIMPDEAAMAKLTSKQRILIYLNGPLAGMAFGLVGFFGTAFITELIRTRSLLAAVTAPVTNPFNNELIQGTMFSTILANLVELIPFLPYSSDGAKIFNELKASLLAKLAGTLAIGGSIIGLMLWEKKQKQW
jgi:hypothetical protein